VNNNNVLGKMMSGVDLFNEYKSAPELEWLVDGVMTVNSLNILAAASNVGKSFLVLDLIRALCSAKGMWMNCYKVRNDSKVMFVDGEDTSTNIGRRLVMLGCYDKGSTFKADNLYYPKNTSVRLNDFESLMMLADYCNKNEIDLVIFDSFAIYCGGDESSNNQMSIVAQNLSHFRNKCNSAVMLLNHVRKTLGATNAKNPITLNDIRGASAIGAMVDSAFGIQRFNNFCRIRTIKGRHISIGNWMDKCYLLENNGLEENDKSYRCFYEMLEDQNADDDLIKSRIVEYISKFDGCSTREIIQAIKGKTTRVMALLKEMSEDPDGVIEMKKEGKKHIWSIKENSGE
jgi:predicted ATP-dependent serine protease